jgi:NADH:ubiquinone oxidoreductase subunit 3 (subunit A)
LLAANPELVREPKATQSYRQIKSLVNSLYTTASPAFGFLCPMEFLTRSLGCIAICATGSFIAMHQRLEIYGWGTAKHRTPAEVLVLGDLLEKSQGGNRSDRFENLLKPRVLTQFASVSWADTLHLFLGLPHMRRIRSSTTAARHSLTTYESGEILPSVSRSWTNSIALAFACVLVVFRAEDRTCTCTHEHFIDRRVRHPT